MELWEYGTCSECGGRGRLHPVSGVCTLCIGARNNPPPNYEPEHPPLQWLGPDDDEPRLARCPRCGKIKFAHDGFCLRCIDAEEQEVYEP